MSALVTVTGMPGVGQGRRASAPYLAPPRALVRLWETLILWMRQNYELWEAGLGNKL